MSVSGTPNVAQVLSTGLTVTGLNLTNGNINESGNSKISQESRVEGSLPHQKSIRK